MADVKLGLATAPVLLSVEHAPEILTLVGRRCQQPGDLEQAMEWVSIIERRLSVGTQYSGGWSCAFNVGAWLTRPIRLSKLAVCGARNSWLPRTSAWFWLEARPPCLLLRVPEADMRARQ